MPDNPQSMPAQGAAAAQPAQTTVENKINPGDSASTVANNAAQQTAATNTSTQQTASSGGGMDIKTDRWL